MSSLIINDPVYGFISVPRGLLCDIVNHRYFHRLSRIRQLGMSAMVYPGASHTRWAHSLGAFHLMSGALQTLTEKGVFLFDVEREAAEAAIMLHDVGHGPYSHVLEGVFIPDMTHEALTLLMTERMNAELRGSLSLALQLLRDEHPKRFLHELICSQLDVDRLDYLCRDSFYTGVREGNVGAARIIKMLTLADNERLVVEEKGLLSVENYLMTRRLMYWQVYLHKTAVAAEEVMRAALRRAKYLAQNGEQLECSEQLHFFLYHNLCKSDFEGDPEPLERFSLLDDSDILVALKTWMAHPDKVLSTLASNFITRRLFRVEVYDDLLPADRVAQLKAEVAHRLDISLAEADYFVCLRHVAKEMYHASGEGIGILTAEGAVRELSDVSHIMRGEAVEKSDRKIYLFVQR